MNLRSGSEIIVNPPYVRSRVAFADINKELGSRWVNLERNKPQYALPATSATSVPPAPQSAMPVLSTSVSLPPVPPASPSPASPTPPEPLPLPLPSSPAPRTQPVTAKKHDQKVKRGKRGTI